MGWLALGLGVALAAAGARLLAGYPRPASRYRRLTAPEAAIVAALADAAFPPGGAIEPSGCEAGVPGYVDRWLDALPSRNRLLIRLLLFLIEHATLLFPGPGLDGWRRFTALRPEQRVAALRGWARSRMHPRRVVFTSLRAILTMAYLGSPTVLRRVGLAPLAIPTPIGDADLLYPRVGASRASIPFGPDDRTSPSDGTPLDPRGPVHPDYAEPSP